MNNKTKKFISAAEDLYYSGMSDFEKICESICTFLKDDMQDVFLKILDEAQRQFEDSLWGSRTNKCSKCRKGNMITDKSFVLTSNPPKYKSVCDICGHIEYINECDQLIPKYFDDDTERCDVYGE